jgi:hypothetical protein
MQLHSSWLLLQRSLLRTAGFSCSKAGSVDRLAMDQVLGALFGVVRGLVVLLTATVVINMTAFKQ